MGSGKEDGLIKSLFKAFVGSFWSRKYYGTHSFSREFAPFIVLVLCFVVSSISLALIEWKDISAEITDLIKNNNILPLSIEIKNGKVKQIVINENEILDLSKPRSEQLNRVLLKIDTSKKLEESSMPASAYIYIAKNGASLKTANGITHDIDFAFYKDGRTLFFPGIIPYHELNPEKVQFYEKFGFFEIITLSFARLIVYCVFGFTICILSTIVIRSTLYFHMKEKVKFWEMARVSTSALIPATFLITLYQIFDLLWLKKVDTILNGSIIVIFGIYFLILSYRGILLCLIGQKMNELNHLKQMSKELEIEGEENDISSS